MQIDLSAPQAEFLRGVLADEIERAEDHLLWLRSEAAKDEEDVEQQAAQTERSVEQAKALLARLG